MLVASSFAFLFVGIFNVGELLFARGELGTTKVGFSVLVALFGLGFIVGSLSAAAGGTLPLLKRRYLLGLLVMGGGLLASGIAPGIAVASVTFAAAGFGNGLVIVYERLLIQARVPDAMAGRVFGLKDGLTAWAFGIGFVVAGGLIELIGVRSAILLAGAGTVLAWVAATVMLRRVWLDDSEGMTGALDRDLLGDAAGREDRADLVGARDHWLTLLDDLK